MSTHSADSANHAPSANLNRQVAQYSLAAAVAGVSMLALGAPAAGEVVVTKKTIHIPVAPWQMFNPVKISIANNGVNNFSFNLYSLSEAMGLLVNGVSARDGVITGSGFYGKALALPRGAKIGPSAAFNNYTDLIEATDTNGQSRYSRGFWAGNLKDHYLGIRFLLNGQTHYGWIRLTAATNPELNVPTLTATITGYAYETVPNKPIKAGTAATATAAAEKPTAELQAPKNIRNQSGPSLGMLAAGADAMPLWREETLTSN